MTKALFHGSIKGFQGRIGKLPSPRCKPLITFPRQTGGMPPRSMASWWKPATMVVAEAWGLAENVAKFINLKKVTLSA